VPGRRKEETLADINRFAGFTSPSRMVRDPFLSREDKISGLATWRGMVNRLHDMNDDYTYSKLVQEINRALRRLHEAS
jgi:hypothetical protein